MISRVTAAWNLHAKTCVYVHWLISFVCRLAELIEEETELFMRKDPDPFDERHPSRTDPECELGRILKLMFRKDNFMTRVCKTNNIYTVKPP